MSFRRILARLAQPVLNPFLDAVAGRVAARLNDPAGVYSGVPSTAFALAVIQAARSLAASGDHRVVHPTDAARPPKRPEELKIGFFGNMANNAYNFINCLRRLGQDAELVLEDGYFDHFLMNRPFWEDIEVECGSYEEGLKHESEWTQPAHVLRVAYDPEMQARYEGRLSAVPELQEKYRESFGLNLAPDWALLLAQNMGHWPYLLAMKRYDVCQFSGAPISLSPFCPRPFVIFPSGGDCYISPFEENPFGLLVRAGYHKARALILSGRHFYDYTARLNCSSRTYVPVIIDSVKYAPVAPAVAPTSNSARKALFFAPARQNWKIKGNDLIFRAIQELLSQGLSEFKVVFSGWGDDLEKSRAFIKELNISSHCHLNGLYSKAVLRRHMLASDAVLDQFRMGEYGTATLEAMSVGTPVMLHYCWANDMPCLRASDAESIARHMAAFIRQPGLKAQLGAAAREWILRWHGPEAVIPKLRNIYNAVYRETAVPQYPPLMREAEGKPA